MASIERQLLYEGPPSPSIIDDLLVKKIDLFTITIIPFNRYQIMKVEICNTTSINDGINRIFYQCEATHRSINPLFFKNFLSFWEEEFFINAIMNELTNFLSTSFKDIFKKFMHILKKNDLLSIFNEFDNIGNEVKFSLKKYFFSIFITFPNNSSFAIKVLNENDNKIIYYKESVDLLEEELLLTIEKIQKLKISLDALKDYPNYFLKENIDISSLLVKSFSINPPLIDEVILSIPFGTLKEVLPEMECSICCMIWLDGECPSKYCNDCSFYYHSHCISATIALRNNACPSCDGGIVNIFL